MRKSLNRQSGMSLIEVMVVLAIMSVLIYGMAGMFEQLQKQQSMLTMNSTYQSLYNQISGAVRSTAGWQGTRDDLTNAEMNCLRLGTNCNVDNTNRIWNELLLRSGTAITPATVVHNSRVANLGFTLSGAPCNTFARPAGGPAQPRDALGNLNPPPPDDPASGDSACPISFLVRWAGTCPNGAVGPTACSNPTLSVWILPFWNPGVGINLPSPNLVKFTGELNFSDGTRNDPVTMWEDLPNDKVSPAASSTTCGANTPRNFTSPKNETTDPSDNLVAAPAGQARLRAGQYECTAYVPAFAVDSFTAEILVNGVAVSSGTSAAPPWSQTTAVVVARIQQTNDFNLGVRMTCQNAGYPTWDGFTFSLGMPVDPYSGGGGPATFRATTVQCSRVN